MTVLIVEDQSAIRQVLAEILADEGYSVICASNGLEAIGYLHRSEQLPFVILLDLAMPVMSGWDFLSELKHEPALESIPVILMTAGANVAQKAFMAGAADYLSKPIDLDTLLEVVERHYPNKGREVA